MDCRSGTRYCDRRLAGFAPSSWRTGACRARREPGPMVQNRTNAPSRSASQQRAARLPNTLRRTAGSRKSRSLPDGVASGANRHRADLPLSVAANMRPKARFPTVSLCNLRFERCMRTYVWNRRCIRVRGQIVKPRKIPPGMRICSGLSARKDIGEQRSPCGLIAVPSVTMRPVEDVTMPPCEMIQVNRRNRCACRTPRRRCYS
jgi:hypothetical protein